jgi:hypothetical protein
MLSPLDDYIDGDVAYLLGLIIGRGTITESGGARQLMIEFPYSSLQAQGITSTFDQETSIRLGLDDIRERLLDLLDTDIKIVRKDGGVDFIARFQRPSMVWRNILYITEGATSYPYFRVPPILYHPDVPVEWKREFVRGYADVAGNIRKANRYVDGRYRVRLDILNYPTNWEVPVQLCLLLQEHLDVPVQLITYGHPNLGRSFREHQLNIFAEAFLKVGFSFEHKQKILEEFAAADSVHAPQASYQPCPGMRKLRGTKPTDPDENNAEKLDARLVGHHFDAYWQICKALGCPRYPVPGTQMEMEFLEDVTPETHEKE